MSWLRVSGDFFATVVANANANANNNNDNNNNNDDDDNIFEDDGGVATTTRPFVSLGALHSVSMPRRELPPPNAKRKFATFATSARSAPHDATTSTTSTVSTSSTVDAIGSLRNSSSYGELVHSFKRFKFPSAPISIVVKTLTGKEIRLSVRENDTVEEVKLMIEELEGIPHSQQRLVFNGTMLVTERVALRACVMRIGFNRVSTAGRCHVGCEQACRWRRLAPRARVARRHVLRFVSLSTGARRVSQLVVN